MTMPPKFEEGERVQHETLGFGHILTTAEVIQDGLAGKAIDEERGVAWVRINLAGPYERLALGRLRKAVDERRADYELRAIVDRVKSGAGYRGVGLSCFDAAALWSWVESLRERKSYPYNDGDVTVIGPQCFIARDHSVLNFAGVNFVPQLDGYKAGDKVRRKEGDVAGELKHRTSGKNWEVVYGDGEFAAIWHEDYFEPLVDTEPQRA